MRKLLLGLAATSAMLVAGAANAATTVSIWHTQAGAAGAAANATIAQAALLGAADAVVTVGAINFTNEPGIDSTTSKIGAFLNNPAGLSATVANFTLNNTYFLFTGQAFLNAGDNALSIRHDDGLQLSFDGGIGTVVDQPGPTAPTITNFTAHAPSAGLYNFTMAYGEVMGGPAVLQIQLNAQQLSGTPEPATWGLMLVGFGGLGAMMRRRRAMALTA